MKKIKKLFLLDDYPVDMDQETPYWEKSTNFIIIEQKLPSKNEQ